MHESKRERYIRILTDKGGADISAEACKELVELLKEADRPKGKWVDRGRAVYPWFESGECNQCGGYGSGAWKFCPNCGADMRNK